MLRVLALIATLLVATLNASLASADVVKPTITRVVYNLSASPKTMTVTGTRFLSPLTVKIGSTALKVVSFTSTNLIANVPTTLAAGDYILTVANSGGSATWTLTYGAVGPQGATGTQGLQGAAGASGSLGPEGDQGEVGPQGPAGPAGPKGDRAESGSDVAVIDADGQIIARWARLTCSDVVRTSTGDAEPQPYCTVTGYRKDDLGNVYIMEFIQQPTDELTFGPSKDDPAMPFLGFADACDGDVPVLPLDNGPWGSVVYKNRIALQRSDNEIWLAALGQKFDVSGYYRAFEPGLDGPCTYSAPYAGPLPAIAITSFQIVNFKAPLQLKFFE